MSGRTVVYRKQVVYHGLSMGSALAMILSFTKNGAILWAIIHGCLSWFYVIFYALETGR
jgi:hypothetical protein